MQSQTTSPGHGSRTLLDLSFDAVTRVRRYLCRDCKRTVSVLPVFALPWPCFSIPVITLFLVARLLKVLPSRLPRWRLGRARMPYERGQFWIRRFQKQVPALGTNHR